MPNGGPIVSHLLYADDALVMGDWSVSNVQNLGRILNCFFMSSGLKVNFQKSNTFGVGVDVQEVQLAASIINCQLGALPFSYPGIPIGENMKNNSKLESGD